MTISAFGYIKGGELNIQGSKRFKAEIRAAKNQDVEIIIKTRGKRSSPQNRYYWSTVVTTIRIELVRLGNDVNNEVVHEFLKEKFNPVYIHDENGEVIATVGGSTTGMNKEEFSLYLDRVFEWASTTLQLAIPPAGTQTKLEYEGL